MQIEKALDNWDGKSVDDLHGIYIAQQQTAGFTDDLLVLLNQTAYQIGASWLLKTWLQSGQRLTAQQITAVYALLPSLQHWQSKLHLLQSLAFMPVAKNSQYLLEDFLRQHLTDTNKFIRAWSYNGFYELARQYPEYIDETRQFFQMAMRDEAPSVKARIRNIIKQGF